ncbi:hypothetical protein QZH41_020775 [Actinostola sp. cb2023]|nr:hypothetical protein QZH41_020775 [Actinostola sp. cb2023]
MLHIAHRMRLVQLGLSFLQHRASVVMGVPVSVKRPSPSYDFSFASFSTTGTLQSSISEAGSSYKRPFTAYTIDPQSLSDTMLDSSLSEFQESPALPSCGARGHDDFEIKVVISGSNVIVRANSEQFKSHKRVKAPLCQPNPAVDKRTFVIIGGGGSAMKAAESLREEGFQGRVVLITKEDHIPYDRPMLSKKLAIAAGDMKLRSSEYLAEHGIEFWSGKEAVGLDIVKKTVLLKGGITLDYDSVLIATGGKPRSLNVPGSDLENVLLLRSPEDANKIAQVGPGKKAVVIGSSFIGMEIAAFLAGKATSVTVVGRSEIPFANVLGKDIGGLLKKMHEEKGVKFISGQTAKEFKGQGGKLKAVVLTDGTELEADICLQGVGVKASTEFLSNTGVPLNSQGHVIVNKYMQACDGVYAAGDIANFPLKMLDGESVTIGHWQMSHKHGLTAARNMLGKNEEINTVPFFWTMQHGKSVRYCGHAHHFDDVIIDGSLEEKKFVAYFVKGEKVLAVATMGRDPVAAKAANLLYEGKMATTSEIR